MTEQVDYSVVGTLDEVEIRRYPRMILATVKGGSEDESFEILFRYISGMNRPSSKIAMTAPVISTGLRQDLVMTAPVLSDASTFSFVMPSQFTLETVPPPMDDRIELQEVPERYLAVLRFGGRDKESLLAEKEIALLDTLAENDIPLKGRPVLMRYNSPWTPGFLRRNEIGVEVEWPPR